MFVKTTYIRDLGIMYASYCLLITFCRLKCKQLNHGNLIVFRKYSATKYDICVLLFEYR